MVQFIMSANSAGALGLEGWHFWGCIQARTARLDDGALGGGRERLRRVPLRLRVGGDEGRELREGFFNIFVRHRVRVHALADALGERRAQDAVACAESSSDEGDRWGILDS